MMNDRYIDQVLVERAQSGDKKAYDLLVVKYQRRLEYVLLKFIKDEHEVYDIAQETFIKAYRALGSFRGDSAFYTWLYRIGVNTAKSYLVNNKKHDVILRDITTGEDDDTFNILELIPDNFTPEAGLINKQILLTVKSAIANLPDELRRAIILREMEGLPYEEIAKIMECPIGTVRSRIFRAREVIANELRPHLGTTKDQRW